jgi:histidyl-tRNA synthetase
MALSTQPYKGARDFYPEDKRLQDYMFDVMRRVARSYGYEEYDAPIVEPIELYTAKSGEEIVREQAYNFMDRGGRHVTLRPEIDPKLMALRAATTRAATRALAAECRYLWRGRTSGRPRDHHRC